MEQNLQGEGNLILQMSRNGYGRLKDARVGMLVCVAVRYMVPERMSIDASIMDHTN
jgi:hypothetical protein